MQKRKGFTLVELVIVIAVIAILAGVLIGTFASVINRANDSAKLQEIKAQEIEQKANDIIKKIEDSNWFGWEDYEADIVAKLTEAYVKNKTTESAVEDAVTTALANIKVGTSDLTEEQVKAIVENALGTVKYEGVTEAQVKAALEVALGDVSTLTSAQVKEIVEAANAKNLTAADLAKAVAGCATIEQVKTALSSATASLATTEQAEAIKNQLNELVLKTTETDNVVLAKALNIQISKLGLTKANVKTPYDAISKLNAEDILKNQSSGNQVMFSLEDVRFFVYDGTTVIYDAATGISSPSYNHWVFANTVDSAYSTYLVGDGVNTTQTANGVGLDVGEATVESVTYSHESGEGRTVVIRTNGGTLTVNAHADTVNHYGDADSVNIVSIASASYHENGKVPFIQISKGRIEIEADGDVNGIHVANVQVVDSEGNITKTANTFTSDVVLTLNGNEVKLTRDTIGTEISSAVLVCAVDVSDSVATEYIWLVGDGTIENSKVYVTATSATPNTDVDSTTTTENASAAAVAIANNAENTGTAESPVYTAHEAGVNAADAEVASALKGTGTETDPFLIYDYATMQKISDFYDKGYYYFAVAIEKTDNGKIDCSGWVPVKLHGSFDGKGVKFTNVTACLFQNVGYQLEEENILLKDFDATMNVSSNGQYGAAALIKNIFNSGITTFDTVNVHGYLEGFWNMGSFYNYGTANYDGNGCNYEVVFNNCYSDATLVCGSGNTCGGFAGHSYEGAGHQFTMRINNSSYAGTIFTTTGKAGAYIAMSSNHGASGENGNYIYVNNERVEFNDGDNMTAYYYSNTNTITTINPTKAENGYFVAKQANVSKIVVTITAQLTAYDNNNVKIDNLSGITMTLSSSELNDLDGSSIKVLDLFNSVNIVRNSSDYNAVISNNVLNISLESSSNYKSGNIRLQVNQYDSTGSIVSAGTIDIATCADATSEWVIK